MDMDIKLLSYLYGLIGTDGSLRKKGNHYEIVIELSEKDKDILQELNKIIVDASLSDRVRNTNFKNNYHSYVLYIGDQVLINKLVEMGLPLKDKTNTIGEPNTEYDIYSFWRGVIDGDGSVGFRNKVKEVPFIGLVTKSENLKKAFVEFIEQECGYTIQCSRNQRDQVYNLSIQSLNAQKLADKLYNNNEISINRKKQKAMDILEWKPTGKQGQHSYRWTEQELDFLRNHTTKEFLIEFPNKRTVNAVRLKKTALNKEVR